MISSMFLSKDEVEQLTGTKLRKLQIEHLARMKIPFSIDRKGEPVLCRDAVAQCLGYQPSVQRIKPSLNYDFRGE